MDMIDDHYYKRAEQFFDDAHHYDKRGPQRAEDLCGRVGDARGTPTPNMGAALGDAAWMTGMERNSDLILILELCAAVCECESGWDAVAVGPDWV
jgi:alpha-N-arabinofuranosidase